MTPLLTGHDADRARAAVAAIAEDLSRQEVADPGLYHGASGIALVHGELARAGHPGALDAASVALERAADALATVRVPWLASGFGGIAFAIEQLGDLIETDAQITDELDASILRVVERMEWPFAWELPIGVLGLGVYGLERAHAPAGRAIVEHTVRHVGALAERDAGGARWLVRAAGYPDEVKVANPSGFTSLGFAYGIGSAIAFLAGAHEIGVDSAGLLADSVRWLRACDRSAATTGDRFAGYIGDVSTTDVSGSRGWCAGDLSLAFVLVRAGLAVQRRDWLEDGLAVARHAARWIAGPGAATGDLSVCHGAVGHGHLLNRIAHATGATDLAETARACYQRALAARVPGTGIGGFTRISRGRKTAAAEYALGLQAGAAGVALGLHAAVADVTPEWDRALLVSLGSVA